MTGFGNSSGRNALERLGRELADREAERETREMLKVARVEARRDRARAAVQDLHALMGDLWARIGDVAPMTIQYSSQRLELEGGALEWDVEHEYVAEGAFARSGWDVFAGAWIRLHQHSLQEYPGMSASLWFAQLPGEHAPAWHLVAYDAEEGNAPAEEPFALRDVIKADTVASSDSSNLHIVGVPLRLDADTTDSFHDYWMGQLAGAAVGELTRPEPPSSREDASVGTRTSPLQDAVAASPEVAEPDVDPRSLFGRLRSLGD